MKKYLLYIGFIVLGLLAGWLLFGTTKEEQKQEHSSEKKVVKNEMWTCSMHPQIMKSEPGDCPICGMELIPTTMSDGEMDVDQFKLTKNAMALANIETTVIKMGENKGVETTINLSGKIAVNEDETATQPAHFNGRIEKLLITSLGQQVHKGEVIAEVYAPELITAQQELITTYKMRATQPALYQAVRKKFMNWKIHNPALLDEIAESGKIRTKLSLYSHVDGTVSEIAVNVGSHVMDGKPIFKVSNLNTVWANFDVYENQLYLFKVGQEIEITTKAFKGKVIKGKVSFIDPILDEQTRTVNLRVVLNNKNHTLKPGMFVEGKIENTIKKSNEIEVPATAVLWTGKRSVVYVKAHVSEPIFELREVILGNKIGEHYVILEGLENGDEVVSNGTFTVDATAQLQGKKSMMNSKPGKISKMKGKHINH